MATIETRRNEDGTTGYRAKVRLKGFPSQSATFERKTDAKEWAKQTEASIREGRDFMIENREKLLPCRLSRIFPRVDFFDENLPLVKSRYSSRGL